MKSLDTSNDYIAIIPEIIHKNKLDLKMVVEATENFTKPALFENMVDISDECHSRSFYEFSADEKLIWRKKGDSNPTSIQNYETKALDYNYVSGTEGTVKEFLDSIFLDRSNVYAHLGYISAGFKDLHKYRWGKLLFSKLKKEVFKRSWFQIDKWDFTGQSFIGCSEKEFGLPQDGYPGSDFHMFPTLNLFVMVSGVKKWATHPPSYGEQLEKSSELVGISGGRERSTDHYSFDTVYLNPGDVLLNVPYEWHRVLNSKGFSCGIGFRVIDRDYIKSFQYEGGFQKLLGVSEFLTRDSLIRASEAFQSPQEEELKILADEFYHHLTSLRYATFDPKRAPMILNWCEQIGLFDWSMRILNFHQSSLKARASICARAQAD